MRFEYFFPNDWATLAKRYLVVSAIRYIWILSFSFDFWASASVLYPNPQVLVVLQRISVNPLLLIDGRFLPALFNLVLALMQAGIAAGAIRLIVRMFTGQGENASGASVAEVDGRKLRRPWWLTPIAMTFSLIISAYILVWVALLVFQGPKMQTPRLGYAFYSAGSIPLYIGLALGFLGLLWGSRFNASARAMVGKTAGVQHLANDHWLTQRVHALAAKLDLPPPTVGVMNAVNAYAAGSKPEDAAVVLGVPLVKKLSPEELDAVIGHELGHIASGDMRRMQFAEGYQRMFGTILGMIGTIGVSIAARQNARAAPLVHLFSNLARFTFAIGSEVMVKGLSRSREYYADAIGASVSSPEAMISALRRLSKIEDVPTAVENEYAYMMFRNGLKFSSLFSTHPTMDRRCAALEAGTHLRAMPLKKLPTG
ncbi:hypothetical protein; putative membrane protein; putative protease (Heat shock protein) [Bradyrhizobium sp. ORS 278]|uniref:M48 family metalloprotease n=1 Tax=Bradyrhizobium sp. (strain ORS 278) TaxID=114615 RepID=UPI00015083DF|nr:M48 family metalloprotease [Bradyrhizobium sp. ORS 278]CAL80007.1 hypothetical protein; putative membrane protein; putative protease (Heat shock protein) [Bradyrhizobium sp. ORS 278]